MKKKFATPPVTHWHLSNILQYSYWVKRCSSYWTVVSPIYAKHHPLQYWTVLRLQHHTKTLTTMNIPHVFINLCNWEVAKCKSWSITDEQKHINAKKNLLNPPIPMCIVWTSVKLYKEEHSNLWVSQYLTLSTVVFHMHFYITFI